MNNPFFDFSKSVATEQNFYNHYAYWYDGVKNIDEMKEMLVRLTYITKEGVEHLIEQLKNNEVPEKHIFAMVNILYQYIKKGHLMNFLIKQCVYLNNEWEKSMKEHP